MMNKIYKVIWNAALQCWVAVSELGKAKGKTKSKKVLSAAAVMAVSAVGVSTNVEAAVNYATGTTFGNGMAIGSSSNANTNAAAYGHGANARALEDVAIGYKTISGAPVSGSTSHSSAQASVAVGTYANATHVATTAIGAHANAINNFATAVGAGAQATAENGSAFGQGATATGVYATALGKGALAKQDYSVALGKEAAANTQLTTSIGSKTNATGFSAIAIGSGHVPPGNTVIENIQGAQATADDSMAVGASALANKEGATALGKLSKATNNNAVAVGPDSVASGSWATATGASANASGQASAAFGESARAGGKKSIATGSHASASGENAIASGANAIATKNGATAVGANTEASGDKATALGDLAKAKNNRATALGHDSQATGEFSTAAGVSSRASGIASVATGKNATASGSNAIATGNAANATGTDSIASGRQASATGTGAVATGAEASASGNAAAYGNKAKATGGWSSAFGNEAKATQSDASAFGNSANASTQGATAVGAHSSVTASGGVALGNGAVANRAARDRNTIVINTADPSKTTGLSDNNNGGDANTVYAPVRLVDTPGALNAIKNTINGNKGAVSVGDSGNTRQIINVAAGSADSDAVNVAQLKAVAGAIKKYSVTSPDGSITVTNPTPGSDPQNFQIKMNTTAVQDAAQWYVKEGNETSGTAVRGGNTVSFNDSSTVDVQHNNKNFTFNVKSGDVTANTNTGAITAPTDGNVLAKAKNVAEAIQRSGWELQANGTKVGLVNPGDKVNIKAGTGVTITPTNEANGISTLTISAAQQNYSWKLKEDSQTAAQALNVTNNTAVSLKGENYLNITNRNGGNFAFKTVTADVGMNTATGATNQATATGLTTNKAVADAIAKSGFQLKENGRLKNVVNPGESLNFKPGQGTTVSVGTNGDVQVNANVADIQAGNNVTVTKGNNGVVTINAKDTNTQASVANGTGLTLTEINNSNGTKKYTLGVNVDNNTIKVENGKLVANLSGVTDTNTQSTVEAKANNFVTVDGSTKNTNGTTKYQVGVTTGDVAVTEATGAVIAISAATGVATNKTVADAIAKSGFQLQENGTLRNVVNPGEILNFKPGKGTTVSVGENGDVQINANVAGITAGKNISTTTDANGNVTINAKDTSAHVKAAESNAAVKVEKAVTTRTENNADITDYTVDLTDQTKTNITHGVNANETVTNKGLTFNGNTGSTGIKKLGSEVDVKGNTSNNVITTTANTNGITVDYNGTAAAQVTSLTYKANNANAKSVTLAKGLDFTNGTQTTAVVEDNGVVKFNVNTTTLSNATGNGNIQVPTGANSDGLVTAKNVANAINTSGWNLQANNVSVGLINPSDKVSFDAGNGVTVTSTNEANGVSHIKVAAKVDGSTITVNDQGQLVANLSGAVNTQASVSNATSSPITIATTKNANGTNNYTVDVNVDGKTITKEGGVLKAVIPSVETVTLTVNTTGNNAGKVEAPATDADKKKLVTAENVAKAINESYWVAKRGDSVTTNADSGDGDSNIAAGNNVTFIAGKNIALQKAGNKFIYATKDDVSFNNVTANNTTTTNLTVKNGGNVDMGNNQVHNIANGTISNNSKDAVNGSQLYAVDNKFNNTVILGGENNSATEAQKLNKDGGLKFNIVGAENGNITTTASGTDVKIDLTEGTKKDIKQGVDANTTVTNKGLTFNANTGNTGAKKLGSEVDVKGGTANNVITTTATEAGITINYNGTEAAKVTHLTYKANGANEQNVSLATGLNFKNGNGTTVTVGANGEVTYNANVTSVVSGNNNATVTTDPNTGVVTINAKDTNTQASVVNVTSSPVTVAVSDNANGTKQYAVDVNVDGKTITKEGGVLKAVIPSVETVTLTVNTTGNNAGKVEAPATDADKKKLVTAENVAKAVNESFWIAKKGDRVETNADTTSADSNVAAGNNVTFIAGKNIALQKAGNKFIYATKDDVSFNNVTANNTTTKNLTVKNGGNVDMGGNQVHNVSTGTAPTDAVNVKQLYDTVSGNVSTESVIKKAGEDNIAEVTVADNKQSGDKNAKYEVSVSKAKIKALANETVKVNTSTAANNPITVTSHTENGNTTYSVNFNGENASKVIPLSYKANDGEAKTVTLSEGLNFKNGTQTTAEVAANGVVKFNVNTTALSNVTNNGKITVPEGNGLVTAKEVAEAINASYWKANAGGNVDGATVADNVTTGTEVFFAAGKNLKVKHSANNFTFSTADDVSFNNVTTNNLTVNAKGNVDMGGNQVHNVANGTKGTDAVNLDQLNATTATANAGWVIKANGTNATTVKPNATVSLNNTDGNILITKNTANNNVTFNFNPNATFGVVGKDGKDGVDGSIGVKGKDGASVVINGKDGSIGLTGPKGADGKDGVSVTLKPEKGTTTVNAKDDGKEIERIKYTANGTTREVATLDDGLKFKGDSKQVINRTLGSQMNITGGADEMTLTDNNIGVVYDKATDGLKVKLAKDVNLTTNGSVVIGNTTLNNNGFTITNKADPSKTVSVTNKGLNNGGNTIINVAPGVNGTDAVNLDQLNATTAIANAGWVIKANGTNATTVKPNATVSLNNTDGNILITKNKTDNNVTFNFNPNATFGVVGKDGKDGVDGSIGVNGKDGSSVVINGKDGSIGLNGKDGKNGLSIKGDQGPAGVDGKDGETKTRIVYEYADPKDPNKTIRENVATLNDGLRFTGNNGVENAHKLNTLVTIVGEGVDKAASANFTSASGNINVKADGKGTLEVQLAKNLKNIETINNGNSTITLNKDGGTTISGGDVSVDGNKVTNVKDGDVSANSKDAVNGSQLYHVMTNATAGWNLSVNNGKDKGNVKPGAQVDLNNTDGNIIISKTANNVTFNFNPNATFGVKGKDGKDGVDGSIGVNGKDGASVVINGKDGSIGLTGPKGADGKDGASANMSVQKGTTTVNTDRDGGKDVTRIVYTDKDKDGKDIKREVATLDDGLKFKGDSEQVINRTLGSQMNITGGADSTKLTDNNIGVVYDEATNGLKVKLSKDVDLGKDGSITIGGTQVTNNGLTIKNGPSVTEKGVDAGNKKVTNVADGDINETSKDAVNGSQLYQAVNNINKNVNAAKTELEEGDNVTITSRVGNNGQTIYKVSSTDNSAHVQGGSDAVSVTKAETTRKDGSTTVTDYTVDLSSKTKDDIKKGVDAHDTVTNKGLTFNADKGTTGAKKLGSQVAVNGDNKNIETVADTNGVKVKLKDDINVNSVTANTFKAGDTIVNTKGVQVAAKDDRGNNTNVVINEKGINAGNTRIQNVAAGRADTDAVNVSQLKGAVTQIGNHINKMDKNLRAGIAGAMAAGGLYHATLPGKSMVAAGAGTYKGESAVAVGYSRLSDNGKVGIKFSVNTNTRGDAGAAASVGYQW
ncbi:YadA-like family protein [Haemophilus parahaemolyticus]|uniref:ESPR-type extended signal peptide-containing protein n=1 Tax=Haemophilus parahaemolyticus TaxID=735 RepID=UPI00352CFE06